MTNEIITVNHNGQIVVSSRDVAEKFEKYHRDVLKSIRVIKASVSTAEFSALFMENEYKASNDKVNPEYLMTRDGFSLLAMSFTGAKALQENGVYYPYAEFSNKGLCVGKWHRAKWGSQGYMKTVFSLEGVDYVRRALKRIGWKPNKK